MKICQFLLGMNLLFGSAVFAGEAPSKVSPRAISNNEIVGYYQSWSAPWAKDGQDHQLSHIPKSVSTVLLSFVLPETNYAKGQNSFVGTGMDFSSNFTTIRDAIRTLKAKNPGTKVLLSVGGATYINWNQANPYAVANLVQDLGADGADIDYEPSAGCGWSTGVSSCPDDGKFIQLIRSFRAALPRPYLLTTAAWSTGAFGTASFPKEAFGALLGANFGLYINPLKAAGQDLDAVFIMSYDAGGLNAPAGQPTGYDYRTAFRAYREIYKGPLIVGVQVPPEAWGSFESTPAEAKTRAQFVRQNNGQGVMIWSLHKPGVDPFVNAICEGLEKFPCY